MVTYIEHKNLLAPMSVCLSVSKTDNILSVVVEDGCISKTCHANGLPGLQLDNEDSGVFLLHI